MQFREWFQEQVFLELFDPEEIEAFEPEDATWDTSPDDKSESWTFRFNVKSDTEKSCYGGPCYYVSIGKNGYIDFGHAQTGTQDRFGARSGEDIETSGNKKVSTTAGKEVMYSILKGIGEIIKKHKPSELRWTPVTKTRYDAPNSRAREKVYKLWAIKALFPQYYVPVSKSHWVRRDKYDAEYVPRGLPELPKTIESNKEKGRLADEMMEKSDEMRQAMALSREEEQRRAREEQARIMVADTYHNPQQLQIGDKVIVKTGTSQGQMGNIKRFEARWGDLFVYIDSDTGEEIRKDIREVVKATESHLATRNRQVGEFMRRRNPENLERGERIICVDKDYDGNFGREGVIVSIDTTQSHEDVLYANVKMDGEEYERQVPMGSIVRLTRPNRQMANRKIREYKQEIESNQRRLAQEYISRYSMDERTRRYLEDPQYNPKKLKIGDEVKIHAMIGSTVDRRGIITGAAYDSYSRLHFRVLFLDRYEDQFYTPDKLIKVRVRSTTINAQG